MKGNALVKGANQSLVTDLLNFTWRHRFKLWSVTWVMLLSFWVLPVRAQTDTLQIFTLDAFFEQIQAYHPVARQANLLSEQARQEIRMARGSFDPEVSSYYAKKEFKHQLYYANWNSLVKVPLWFGADLKAGYELNRGSYLNPELKTPAQGLSYAGISVPLGQGWIMDQRRATLRQAQLLSQAAEADKVKILNKLLLEAAKDYWDWAYAYQRWVLYQEAYELAATRYRGVRERVREGDLAAIDTVEAQIEVTNRKLMWQQAQTDFRNGSLILSNYLWRDDTVPVELVTGVVPEIAELTANSPAAGSPDLLPELLEYAQRNHPDILKLEVKSRQLVYERRLAGDKLKPKLTLDYNFLRQDIGLPMEDIGNSFLANNYKMGLYFSMPLFLRTERGKLQLTKIKIQDNNLALQQANRDIVTNLQTTHNELLLLAEQITAQETLARQTEVLRNGEQIRFENGESSLFLVNTREMNLVNQRVKLWELRTKYAKGQAMLNWAAGNLGN